MAEGPDPVMAEEPDPKDKLRKIKIIIKKEINSLRFDLSEVLANSQPVFAQLLLSYHFINEHVYKTGNFDTFVEEVTTGLTYQKDYISLQQYCSDFLLILRKIGGSSVSKVSDMLMASWNAKLYNITGIEFIAKHQSVTSHKRETRSQSADGQLQSYSKPKVGILVPNAKSTVVLPTVSEYFTSTGTEVGECDNLSEQKVPDLKFYLANDSGVITCTSNVEPSDNDAQFEYMSPTQEIGNLQQTAATLTSTDNNSTVNDEGEMINSHNEFPTQESVLGDKETYTIPEQHKDPFPVDEHNISQLRQRRNEYPKLPETLFPLSSNSREPARSICNSSTHLQSIHEWNRGLTLQCGSVHFSLSAVAIFIISALGCTIISLAAICIFLYFLIKH